jgi:hypothetical protein
MVIHMMVHMVMHMMMVYMMVVYMVMGNMTRNVKGTVMVVIVTSTSRQCQKGTEQEKPSPRSPSHSYLPLFQWHWTKDTISGKD